MCNQLRACQGIAQKQATDLFIPITEFLASLRPRQTTCFGKNEVRTVQSVKPHYAVPSSPPQSSVIPSGTSMRQY